MFSSVTRCRPSSAALVIAMLALFVSLGGIGSAATSPPHVSASTTSAIRVEAYAHIKANGHLDRAHSKNIRSGNVTETSPHSGIYCFRHLSFTPHNAVATAGFSANGDTVIVEVAGTRDFGLTGCAAGTQIVAITFVHPAHPGNQDADFSIQVM